MNIKLFIEIILSVFGTVLTVLSIVDRGSGTIYRMYAFIIGVIMLAASIAIILN